MTESYITHIRIIEDAAYPSTPAPPNSPPDNKKPRLIIVALRKSGRVRMHKARENNDGTFSIGKTWMLDDLNAIQAFGDVPATTQLEEQYNQWASNVGFVVTVGKSYYWQASNYKERDFFIASLVKIYKKYTGGRVPRLIGFDEKQRQALIGDANPEPLRPEADSRQAPPSSHGPQPGQPNANRAPSREGRNDSRSQLSDDQSLRSQRSRDPVLRASPSPGRPPKIPRDRDNSSPNVNGRQATERLAETPRAVSRGREQSPVAPRQPHGASQSREEKETYGMVYNRALDVAREPLRPSTAGSESTGPFLSQSLSSENNLQASRPSSRGDTPSSQGGNISNRSSRNLETIPPSLRPGSMKLSTSNGSINIAQEPNKDEATPAIAPVSSDPSSVQPIQEIADSSPTPAETEVHEQEEISEEPPQAPVSPQKSTIPPAAEDDTDDPEAHRPGLGPMIKKKSAKDIAGAFRKAATAYGAFKPTAFKPRPGGAGERLLAKDKPQTDEPDGITSVVPAPALRGLSNDSTKPSATLETVVSQPTPPTESLAQEPPKVEITRANTEEMVPPPTIVTPEASDVRPPEITQETSRSRSISPAQERRRRRREDNIVKYCQALDIEASLVEGTGGYFDEILTDLGWNGRLSDEKKIEDLEADIRREIGRVQATSWLGNIEQQEGKIDQLAKLIDRTIEECEELDGLLTLYSHELGVSDLFP